MSRIEELQIKHDFLSRQIADYKRVLSETEDEIKAAMIESKGPKEWNVYLSHTGDIYPEFRLCPAGRTDKITVIEKKPLVITTELAQKMINAGRGFVVTPAWFVRALKAAGIEARRGDE